jgi:hypothetical protein
LVCSLCLQAVSADYTKGLCEGRERESWTELNDTDGPQVQFVYAEMLERKLSLCPGPPGAARRPQRFP